MVVVVVVVVVVVKHEPFESKITAHTVAHRTPTTR